MSEIFIFLKNRHSTPIDEFIVFKYMYMIWHIGVHLLHLQGFKSTVLSLAVLILRLCLGLCWCLGLQHVELLETSLYLAEIFAPLCQRLSQNLPLLSAKGPVNGGHYHDFLLKLVNLGSHWFSSEHCDRNIKQCNRQKHQQLRKNFQRFFTNKRLVLFLMDVNYICGLRI